MKSMKSFIVFTVFALVLFSPLFSQVKESWKYSSKDEVLWQEVNSLGNLIVAARSALIGVNPETGKEMWACNQFAGIAHEQIGTLEGSPLLSITQSGVIHIVEPFNGKTLFNSQAAGIEGIDTTCFLYRNNGMLITGKKSGSKDAIMMMVSMTDGKINWKLEEKFGRIIAVEELSASEIFIVTLFNNYKINSATGSIIWKNTTSKDAEKLNKMGALGNAMKAMAEEAAKNMNFDLRLYMPENPEIVYLGSQTESQSSMSSGTTTSSSGAPMYSNSYYAYRTSDGSPVWDEPIEMTGKLGQVALDPLGFIVLPDNGGRTMINMFDYNTKAGKWGKKFKGIPIKGGVYDYISTEKGYVLVTRSGEKNFLNFLDPEQGILTFEEPVKINGSVVGIIPVEKGFLFITTDEINILDPAMGKLILAGSVSTRPELTARKDDLIYAYDLAEKKLVSVDMQNAAVKVLSATPVVFEGKETPNSIELRDNGIFISSEQNVALIGYNGTLVYKNYYPAPREPGLKRALLYAQAIRAAYIGANSYYASAAFQSAAPKVNDPVAGAVFQEVGKAYGQLGDVAADFAKNSFQQANARLKATTQSRDFMFIMVQEDKAISLAKINKNSGKIDGRIDLGKDRTPEYAVDDITGQVYLKSAINTVSSFKF